jgi:hypothetical protein
MERKCYRCGSSNVARVVPPSMAADPDVRKEILEGKAVAACCSAGFTASGLYRCKDCNFEWDYYYERARESER